MEVFFKVYKPGPKGPGTGGTVKILGNYDTHKIACSDHKGTFCVCVQTVLAALTQDKLPAFTKVYEETLKYPPVAKSPVLTEKVKAALIKIEAAKAGAVTDAKPAPVAAPKPAPVAALPVVNKPVPVTLTVVTDATVNLSALPRLDSGRLIDVEEWEWEGIAASHAAAVAAEKAKNAIHLAPSLIPAGPPPPTAVLDPQVAAVLKGFRPIELD
jgi:hypothetical protein